MDKGHIGRSWDETNARELLLWWGLWIVMALNQQSRTELYWEKEDDPPFVAYNFGRYC